MCIRDRPRSPKIFKTFQMLSSFFFALKITWLKTRYPTLCLSPVGYPVSNLTKVKGKLAMVLLKDQESNWTIPGKSNDCAEKPKKNPGYRRNNFRKLFRCIILWFFPFEQCVKWGMMTCTGVFGAYQVFRLYVPNVLLLKSAAISRSKFRYYMQVRTYLLHE